MMTGMETLTQGQKKDIRLIGKFVEVYCAGKHKADDRPRFSLPSELGERRLCEACSAFMTYAIARRINCPLEADKPSCKRCRIHCYGTQRRRQVREIMSYAGRKLLLRGRLDYLWHYLS